MLSGAILRRRGIPAAVADELQRYGRTEQERIAVAAVLDLVPREFWQAATDAAEAMGEHRRPGHLRELARTLYRCGRGVPVRSDARRSSDHMDLATAVRTFRAALLKDRSTRGITVADLVAAFEHGDARGWLYQPRLAGPIPGIPLASALASLAGALDAGTLTGMLEAVETEHTPRRLRDAHAEVRHLVRQVVAWFVEAGSEAPLPAMLALVSALFPEVPAPIVRSMRRRALEDAGVTSREINPRSYPDACE